MKDYLFKRLAEDWGVSVEEAQKRYEEMDRWPGSSPVVYLPWWGPTKEEQEMLRNGLLDPRHFSRETTQDRWKYIPLRDLDGRVIPFSVRRIIAHAIGHGEEEEQSARRFIERSVKKWTEEQRSKLGLKDDIT